MSCLNKEQIKAWTKFFGPTYGQGAKQAVYGHTVSTQDNIMMVGGLVVDWTFSAESSSMNRIIVLKNNSLYCRRTIRCLMNGSAVQFSFVYVYTKLSLCKLRLNTSIQEKCLHWRQKYFCVLEEGHQTSIKSYQILLCKSKWQNVNSKSRDPKEMFLEKKTLCKAIITYLAV